MVFNNIQQFFIDLPIALNFIIFLVLLQIGMLFIRNWYIEREKDIKNYLMLGYGMFYMFLALSAIVGLILDQIHVSSYVSTHFLLIKVLLRGIGAIFFTYYLEKELQKSFKIKPLLSICLLILVALAPVFIYFEEFNRTYVMFNILYLVPQFIMVIYFIGKEMEKIRRKLLISVLGMLDVFVGLVFVKNNQLYLFYSFPEIHPILTITFQFLVITGTFLIIYGFQGYSFSLEFQWKKKIISFLVIDKKQNMSIYHKDFFDRKEVISEDLFSSGLIGITNIIQEFTERDKNVDLIKINENFIILEHGNNIITALIVKKNMAKLRLKLKEINSKFEQYFGGFIEKFYVDNSIKLISTDLMEKITNKIIIKGG